MTVSEVKRYGHISYLVEATPAIIQLYPAMTVYVLASDFDAAQSELAALREELATLKSPGPLCFCGLKQTKNPHPEAGVPPGYLEVGTVYDCIPCLNKSRRAWSKKANRLQAELTAAEQRNATLIDLIQKAHTWVDRNNFGGWDAYELRDQLAAALKPTESGASE